MMKKRIAALAAVFVLVFAAACGNNAPGGVPGAGGADRDSITILVPTLPGNLVPWASNDVPTNEVKRLIFDRLFVPEYTNMSPNPERQLAVSWSQPDARTTNIEIRRGVYFHNGDPLTAHDVRFSLMEASVSTFSMAFLGIIEDVEVHDDFNLTIRTSMDFVPIISHLTLLPASIVNARLFQEIGMEAYAARPIGSGAWMFDEFIIGDRLELVANPNYWGGSPQLERLTWRLVAEPSVRLMEVMAGTADVAMAVAPLDISLAEADPSVVLHRGLNLISHYIGFNVERPYISNRLVRRAISYAIDVDAIFNAVFMGSGVPLHGPFPPQVWGFYEMEPIPFNLDRARELLVEAGYPNGFSTTILWSTGTPANGTISEMVQFTLAQIGINVEIISMEWAAYMPFTEAGQHDMFVLSRGSTTGDPDYSTWPMFHSESTPGAGARTFISNPQLDALLDAGRVETDPARRLEIYRDVQLLLGYEAPWVFLRAGEHLVASTPNLRGLSINPAGHHDWSRVWFE